METWRNSRHDSPPCSYNVDEDEAAGRIGASRGRKPVPPISRLCGDEAPWHTSDR